MITPPDGKKHVIWVRIAKTGSTSTEYTLRDCRAFCTLSLIHLYKPGTHVLACDDLNKLEAHGIDVDDCWIFTVVRDPLQRAISSWRGHTSFRESSFIDTLRNPPKKPRVNLEGPGSIRAKCYRNEGVCHCIRCQDSAWRHFSRTQTEVCTVDGEFLVDQMIRFENRHADLLALMHRIGLDASGLPERHDNASRFHERPVVGDEEARLVKELFTDDYETFGFEDPCSKSLKTA